ncbi:MAG: YihY/virulence factor BrkB family protein [Candidatus Nanopelagicales bacterium]
MSNWMRAAGRRLSSSALGDAFLAAYQTRITGLAAEASFWAIFALPWLLLGMVAGLARLQNLLGVDAVGQFRAEALELSDQVLTQQAIDDLVVPLLDSVFGRGRTTLGLMGIIVAIWAGSRVVDALINAMTIVYRREGLRSMVRTKLLSLGVYISGLAVLIVAFPLILAGPTALVRVLPGAQGTFSSVLLVSAQVGVLLVLLVSLYHWAVPHRTGWAADIPGALIAIVLWVGFSWLLRWYFLWIFREGSVYGAIAAPVAVMYWVYVTVLALMLGAAFNGALALRRGWFVHPEHQAERDAPDSAGATED